MGILGDKVPQYSECHPKNVKKVTCEEGMDSELDFCSNSFNAKKVLQTEVLNLPFPKANPYNNLAEYKSKMSNRRPRKKPIGSASELSDDDDASVQNRAHRIDSEGSGSANALREDGDEGERTEISDCRINKNKNEVQNGMPCHNKRNLNDKTFDARNISLTECHPVDRLTKKTKEMENNSKIYSDNSKPKNSTCTNNDYELSLLEKRKFKNLTEQQEQYNCSAPRDKFQSHESDSAMQLLGMHHRQEVKVREQDRKSPKVTNNAERPIEEDPGLLLLGMRDHQDFKDQARNPLRMIKNAESLTEKGSAVLLHELLDHQDANEQARNSCKIINSVEKLTEKNSPSQLLEMHHHHQEEKKREQARKSQKDLALPYLETHDCQKVKENRKPCKIKNSERLIENDTASLLFEAHDHHVTKETECRKSHEIKRQTEKLIENNSATLSLEILEHEVAKEKKGRKSLEIMKQSEKLIEDDSATLSLDIYDHQEVKEKEGGKSHKIKSAEKLIEKDPAALLHKTREHQEPEEEECVISQDIMKQAEKLLEQAQLLMKFHDQVAAKERARSSQKIIKSSEKLVEKDKKCENRSAAGRSYKQNETEELYGDRRGKDGSGAVEKLKEDQMVQKKSFEHETDHNRLRYRDRRSPLKYHADHHHSKYNRDHPYRGNLQDRLLGNRDRHDRLKYDGDHHNRKKYDGDNHGHLKYDADCRDRSKYGRDRQDRSRYDRDHSKYDQDRRNRLQCDRDHQGRLKHTDHGNLNYDRDRHDRLRSDRDQHDRLRSDRDQHDRLRSDRDQHDHLRSDRDQHDHLNHHDKLKTVAQLQNHEYAECENLNKNIVKHKEVHQGVLEAINAQKHENKRDQGRRKSDSACVSKTEMKIGKERNGEALTLSENAKSRTKPEARKFDAEHKNQERYDDKFVNKCKQKEAEENFEETEDAVDFFDYLRKLGAANSACVFGDGDSSKLKPVARRTEALQHCERSRQEVPSRMEDSSKTKSYENAKGMYKLRKGEASRKLEFDEQNNGKLHNYDTLKADGVNDARNRKITEPHKRQDNECENLFNYAAENFKPNNGSTSTQKKHCDQRPMFVMPEAVENKTGKLRWDHVTEGDHLGKSTSETLPCSELNEKRNFQDIYCKHLETMTKQLKQVDQNYEFKRAAFQNKLERSYNESNRLEHQPDQNNVENMKIIDHLRNDERKEIRISHDDKTENSKITEPRKSNAKFFPFADESFEPNYDSIPTPIKHSSGTAITIISEGVIENQWNDDTTQFDELSCSSNGKFWGESITKASLPCSEINKKENLQTVSSEDLGTTADEEKQVDQVSSAENVRIPDHNDDTELVQWQNRKEDGSCDNLNERLQDQHHSAEKIEIAEHDNARNKVTDPLEHKIIERWGKLLNGDGENFGAKNDETISTQMKLSVQIPITVLLEGVGKKIDKQCSNDTTQFDEHPDIGNEQSFVDLMDVALLPCSEINENFQDAESPKTVTDKEKQVVCNDELEEQCQNKEREETCDKLSGRLESHCDWNSAGNVKIPEPCKNPEVRENWISQSLVGSTNEASLPRDEMNENNFQGAESLDEEFEPEQCQNEKLEEICYNPGISENQHDGNSSENVKINEPCENHEVGEKSRAPNEHGNTTENSSFVEPLGNAEIEESEKQLNGNSAENIKIAEPLKSREVEENVSLQNQPNGDSSESIKSTEFSKKHEIGEKKRSPKQIDGNCAENINMEAHIKNVEIENDGISQSQHDWNSAQNVKIAEPLRNCEMKENEQSESQHYLNNAGNLKIAEMHENHGSEESYVVSLNNSYERKDGPKNDRSSVENQSFAEPIVTPETELKGKQEIQAIYKSPQALQQKAVSNCPCKCHFARQVAAKNVKPSKQNVIRTYQDKSTQVDMDEEEHCKISFIMASVKRKRIFTGDYIVHEIHEKPIFSTSNTSGKCNVTDTRKRSPRLANKENKSKQVEERLDISYMRTNRKRKRVKDTNTNVQVPKKWKRIETCHDTADA